MQEMQEETQVGSLGHEDPLEPEMATHSSMLTWKIPWTEEAGLVSKISADSDFSHEIKRPLLLESKVMTHLDSILKRRYYFANKGPSSQSYGFSSSQVWM